MVNMGSELMSMTSKGGKTGGGGQEIKMADMQACKYAGIQVCENAQSVDQSISQSISRSVDQSINQSVDQSSNSPVADRGRKAAYLCQYSSDGGLAD
jgi:hypothetical protein